jgi:HK97 family phage major capsid protein
VGAGYGFSIEQFQDSAWDIPGELSMAYREDFEVGVATACVKGNGVGKPTGFIDKVSGMNSGAVALTTNMLIRLQENLLEQYQRNASWLFNRKTRAYIRSLVLSATNGLQYTWEPDFQRGAPTLLLGDPIYIAADGDLAGLVTGNFTAGDRPIVYGDFKRGYEVTMHTDMYIIDDPYSESNAFVRNINIMSRVDGKPLEADKALVALHITTS